MAPQYRLTYFNGRGLAESVRLVFAAADVDYVDERIAKEDWPTFKLTCGSPSGQLPMLTIDGQRFCQSKAIARYLARKFDLAGKTEIEQLQADMIVDCCEDILKPILVFLHESDETRKAELKKKFLEEQLPASLSGLEKILIQNNGGDGYVVGTSLTWADLILLNLKDLLGYAQGTEEIQKHPKLNALIGRIAQEPKVAAWLAKRPATEF